MASAEFFVTRHRNLGLLQLESCRTEATSNKGIATRDKGITTGSKNATRGSWHYY